MVQAYSTGRARTFAYGHDQNLGVVTSVTDSDNSTVTTYGYDTLGRVTSVDEANVRKTQTAYEDSNRRVVVKRDLASHGDGLLISVTDYDQLGRVRLTRQLEDGSSQNPDDDTAGIKVQTRYMYSGANSYRLESNPFRASYSTGTGEVTMGWTRTKFDTDGRTIESQSFDGSAPPAPWGNNSNSPYGTVTTAYNSEKTTVTDQASVVHDYYVDGRGRLVQVTEYPGTGSLLTTYAYDALDDLVCAAQNSVQGTACASQTGQKRTFVYTSLKRLYTAANPESGTSTYNYDDNGNLTYAYDARPTGTNRVQRLYDELNRVTDKKHDDGSTPDVSYTYGIVGTSPAYGIGRLTQVSVPSKSTAANYTAFDPLGRVTASNQTTNGQTYGFSYTYNAASLSSETYPSGRTVTTSYDTANRVSQVAATFPANKTYVSGITYAPHGDFASYGYGNGVGRSATYNPRLQPTAMTDSISGKPNYALQLLPYLGGQRDPDR